jgi:hypothetical protein
VDIDTLWRHKDTKKDFQWKGRVCKVYTRMTGGGWKPISRQELWIMKELVPKIQEMIKQERQPTGKGTSKAEPTVENNLP